MNNEKTIIAKDNKPDTLVGWWDFDDFYVSDRSGLKNDMIDPPPAGPQFGTNLFVFESSILFF